MMMAEFFDYYAPYVPVQLVQVQVELEMPVPASPMPVIEQITYTTIADELFK